MALFAATDGALRAVRAEIPRRRRSYEKEPRACCGSCRIGAPRAVPAARRRRLHVVSISRATWAGRSSRRFARDLFRQYLRLAGAYYDRSRTGGTLLSRLTYNIEQVAEADHQVHHLADPRLAHDRRADRLAVRTSTGGSRCSCWCSRRRCRWLIRKVISSFRRYSARIQASMGDVTRVGEGSARRPARHQGVQRAGARGARVREGQRAQPHAAT